MPVRNARVSRFGSLEPREPATAGVDDALADGPRASGLEGLDLRVRD
jgi:hypothetical protein